MLPAGDTTNGLALPKFVPVPPLPVYQLNVAPVPNINPFAVKLTAVPEQTLLVLAVAEVNAEGVFTLTVTVPHEAGVVQPPSPLI